MANNYKQIPIHLVPNQIIEGVGTYKIIDSITQKTQTKKIAINFAVVENKVETKSEGLTLESLGNSIQQTLLTDGLFKIQHYGLAKISIVIKVFQLISDRGATLYFHIRA